MVDAGSIPEVAPLEFDVRMKRRRSARLLVHPRGIQLSPAPVSLRRLGDLTGRFVPSSRIHNVYREGDCVRVEYRDAGHYSVLQFWAQDPIAAARIVAHLPTGRTVELESSAHDAAPRRVRPVAKGSAALVAAAFVLIPAGAWWLEHGLSAVTPRSSPGRPPSTLAPRTPAPSGVAATTSVPLSATDVPVLRTDLTRATVVHGALESQFRVALAALEDGSLTREDFSFGLERWLAPQWRSRETQLELEVPVSPRTRQLRSLELDAAEDWQVALRLYVTGLRERDPEMVLRAFRYIGRAEQAERLAQGLVDRAAASAAPDATAK